MATLNISTDPTAFGTSLFVRIAQRQEAAAQVRFLHALQSSSLADKAVVCGSAALHGIFLHGRRTPSLDLVMPPLWAVRFPALMQAAGVTVCASPARNRYVLAASETSIPGLKVYIRIRPAQRMPENIERRTFSDISGNKASVATLPLVDLAVNKLNVLAERHDLTDYLDAWLVLTKAPEAASVSTKLLAVSPSGSFSSNAFDARKSLLYIDMVDDAQWQVISQFVCPVPPLSQVADDLSGWWKTFFDSQKGS